MTLASKITTAALFALVSILAALILSLGMPVMDVNAAPLMPAHSTVQTSTLPFMGGELYRTALTCDTCPVSLPPTSGEMTELETMWYTATEAIKGLIDSVL